MKISSSHRSPAADPAADPLVAEMARLEREHRGDIYLHRAQTLRDQLAARSGIAVLRSTSGFCGDRPTLWLDTGWVLRLHLFWPQRRPLVILSGLRWTEVAGWVVDGVADDGSAIRCFAWKIAIDPQAPPEA